jgi:hypothetical protein
LFQADADLAAQYNHQLAGGKWNHTMDQTHIGYTNWQEPPVNTMPKVTEIALPNEAKTGGVVPEGPVAISARALNAPKTAHGFVESAGSVSIEAEHYSRKTEAGGAHWDRIPDCGRTLSCMTVFPVTSPSLEPPAAPSLEYPVYLLEADAPYVHLILSPTLNFVPGRGLRFAIAWDDQPPKIVDALAHNSQRDWEQTVKDGVRTVIWMGPAVKPGSHVLKVWMVDPGVVLQKIVIDCGGLKPSYLGPPESLRVP